MKGLERIAADRRHLIAAQVRCSTGYTWGRAGAPGSAPVVAGVKPTLRAAGPSRVEARAAAVSRAQKLLALLHAWPEGEPLAAATELGRRLGLVDMPHANDAVEAVARSFLKLEVEGALVSIAGTRERFRGQRAVLLAHPRRLLRTADAPAFWDQLLAGALP